MLLVGLSWAILPRSASAQLELCAGQPCPKTETADEPSVQGEERAAPPRAVLIDAIVLTPALEKANARLGIEQSVAAVLKNAGWDPVSVTTDCKDLGCASAAAAAAKASYALLLTGRFVKQETYVADIGVSLWRDGTVVSSQNEPQEEARYRSAGRSGFMLCGPPSGICTTKLLATKLQDYTTSLVDAENVRIRVRRRVAAAAALAPKPVVSPLAPPVAVEVHPSVPALPISEAPNHRRALGWSLVIGGGVLMAGGIALWAVNDKGTDCHSVAGDADSCRGRLNTRPPAIVSGVVGLAAAGVGVAILRWGRNEGQVALSSDGRGLSVGGRF